MQASLINGLPKVTHDLIREDLDGIVAQIDAIESGQSPNNPVIDHHYTSALCDDSVVVPLDDPGGELAYLRRLKVLVKSILSDGHIRPEHEDQWIIFEAPRYIIDLFDS